MPRNFNGAARDPLLVAGRAAACCCLRLSGRPGLWLYPPGGSADELEQQLAALKSQTAAKRALLASTRQHVAAVEQGRTEGDQFLNQYFLARRTAYSTLLSELVDAADRAKIKPKETRLRDGADRRFRLAQHDEHLRQLRRHLREPDALRA